MSGIKKDNKEITEKSSSLQAIIRRYVVIQTGFNHKQVLRDITISPCVSLRYVDARSKEEALGIFMRKVDDSMKWDQTQPPQVFEQSQINTISA